MSLSPIKLKLTEEGREELLQLFETQGWVELVHVLQQLVQAKGSSVLTLQDEDRFLKAKAEYDGVVKFFADIQNLKQIVSPKKKS